MKTIYCRKTIIQLISVPLIIGGAAAAILGRHSVLGLCIGFGMMFFGWAMEEVAP